MWSRFRDMPAGALSFPLLGNDASQKIAVLRSRRRLGLRRLLADLPAHCRLLLRSSLGFSFSAMVTVLFAQVLSCSIRSTCCLNACVSCTMSWASFCSDFMRDFLACRV